MADVQKGEKLFLNMPVNVRGKISSKLIQLILKWIRIRPRNSSISVLCKISKDAIISLWKYKGRMETDGNESVGKGEMAYS